MDSWIYISDALQYSFDLTNLLCNGEKINGDFFQLNEFVNKGGELSISKKLDKKAFSFSAFRNVTVEFNLIQLSSIAETILQGNLPSKEFVDFLDGNEIQYAMKWNFKFDKSIIPNQQIATQAAKLLVCNNSKYISASMGNSLEKYVEFSIEENTVRAIDFNITCEEKNNCQRELAQFDVEFCCSYKLKNKSRDLYKDLEKGPLSFGNNKSLSYFDAAKTIINHAENIYLNAGRNDFLFYYEGPQHIALRPKDQEYADILFEKDYDVYESYAEETTKKLMYVIHVYYPAWKPKKTNFLLRDIHLRGVDERGVHFGLNWKANEIYDSNYISRMASILASVESIKKNKDGFYLDSKVVEKRSVSIKLEKSSMIPELYERGFEDPDFLKNQKRIGRYLENLKKILNALLKFCSEVVFSNGQEHSFAVLVRKAVRHDPLAFINAENIPVANYAKTLLNGSLYGDTLVNYDLERIF